MSQASIIAKNTFWQTLGKIAGTILGLITVGLLTRYLGQSGFGQYTTALAFMQFFGVLIDFGLYIICLKEISAKPEQENKIYNNFFSLRLVTALFFLGLGAILIFLFPYPSATKWSGAIVSLSFFFMALVQIQTTLFQKYLRMGLVALAEIFGRLTFLIGVILFIALNWSLPFLMLANVANSLVYFIILWFLTKKFIRPAWSVDLSYWRQIFKQTWPLALGIIFNLVYFRADTIILSLYHSAQVVGLYGAPYKILEIITTFPHMFMGLVMPLLTAAWLSRNHERFQKISQKVLDFFIILTVPMVLGSLPLSKNIMVLIAGSEFADSGKILPILILATAIIFFGTVFTYGVVIIDTQKTMLKYFFLGAIFSLLGYFTLIPRYSYWAAAWVTVAVEAFIVIAAWLIYFKTTKLTFSFKILGKTLLSSHMMMAVLYLLPSAIPAAVSFIIGLAVYGLVMLAIKGIDKKIVFDMIKFS